MLYLHILIRFLTHTLIFMQMLKNPNNSTNEQPSVQCTFSFKKKIKMLQCHLLSLLSSSALPKSTSPAPLFSNNMKLMLIVQLVMSEQECGFRKSFSWHFPGLNFNNKAIKYNHRLT